MTAFDEIDGAPLSSVAVAVMTWFPAAALVHTTLNDGPVSSANRMPSARILTSTTLPSASEAVTFTLMGWPGANSACEAGDVIVTAGGKLTGITLMDTLAESEFTYPSLATNVKLSAPAKWVPGMYTRFGGVPVKVPFVGEARIWKVNGSSSGSLPVSVIFSVVPSGRLTD